MRAGFAFIFVVLVSSLWAASPVFAARTKAPQQVKATIVQTSTAIEQHGSDQRCDLLEDTEVITATYHQQPAYGPAVLIRIHRFNANIYPAAAAPLPGSRDNARIQPFYQLILFPFHGFW